MHTQASKPPMPHSKSAYAVYVFAMSLMVGGVLLVLVGLVGGLFPKEAASQVETRPVRGEQLYRANCAACHGLDLGGIASVGKSLRNSAFIAAQSDEALHDFIVTGRPIWDAANTTGVEMPAYGGNPLLSDAEIGQIIAYIRSEGDY